MQALHFILSALFTLVVIAFLLRVLMPLVRADFRNPFGEAVLQVTNPLVLPLRKVMPPGKRLDPSSVVALLIVQFAGTALLRGVAGGGFGLESILLGGVYGLLHTVLQFYFFAVLLYALAQLVRGRGLQPGCADPEQAGGAAARADSPRRSAAGRTRPVGGLPADRAAGAADPAAMSKAAARPRRAA
ncbi:MAG: YggT family protein [Proteobacteria bacterium]|nr:YggT family protein [Pseudomonadota bacterium]